MRKSLTNRPFWTDQLGVETGNLKFKLEVKLGLNKIGSFSGTYLLSRYSIFNNVYLDLELFFSDQLQLDGWLSLARSSSVPTFRPSFSPSIHLHPPPSTSQPWRPPHHNQISGFNKRKNITPTNAPSAIDRVGIGEAEAHFHYYI
jgi:hypothetical protein